MRGHGRIHHEMHPAALEAQAPARDHVVQAPRAAACRIAGRRALLSRAQHSSRRLQEACVRHLQGVQVPVGQQHPPAVAQAPHEAGRSLEQLRIAPLRSVSSVPIEHAQHQGHPAPQLGHSRNEAALHLVLLALVLDRPGGVATAHEQRHAR
eukprot:5096581-Alexandrium_andersonii.AAC.1